MPSCFPFLVVRDMAAPSSDHIMVSELRLDDVPNRVCQRDASVVLNKAASVFGPSLRKRRCPRPPGAMVFISPASQAIIVNGRLPMRFGLRCAAYRETCFDRPGDRCWSYRTGASTCLGRGVHCSSLVPTQGRLSKRSSPTPPSSASGFGPARRFVQDF